MLDKTYWNVNYLLKNMDTKHNKMFNIDQKVNHIENISFRVLFVLFPQSNTCFYQLHDNLRWMIFKIQK